MLGSTKDLTHILQRIAARDRGSFPVLYDATCAKLYGVIVRIVSNRSSADEILQEVYVKIWQNAGDFDQSRASPITWMATIARNRAIDEVRRSKQHETRDTDAVDEIAAELDHPLDERARSDELKSLLACLGALEDEKRQIILLAYYRGMSREALAKRFNRPVPTIKTWLHRGLAQLKTCLTT